VPYKNYELVLAEIVHGLPKGGGALQAQLEGRHFDREDRPPIQHMTRSLTIMDAIQIERIRDTQDIWTKASDHKFPLMTHDLHRDTKQSRQSPLHLLAAES
jgi:hypothetical protein